jgi:hypothetical protein
MFKYEKEKRFSNFYKIEILHMFIILSKLIYQGKWLQLNSIQLNYYSSKAEKKKNP